jgi:GT2 family glycosyltransferase
VVAGAFAFALDAEIPGRRWIEWGTNRRARERELPYGDQGLFLTREQFDRAGGFPDLPLLEDYVLVRRLRRHGRIGFAPAAVITSARRWRHRGFWRTLLLNQAILAGYHFGIPPARLARWYRGPAPQKAGNIITPSPL